MPEVAIRTSAGAGCLDRRQLSLEVTCAVQGEPADPSTLSVVMTYPDGTTVNLKPRLSFFGCDGTGELGSDLLLPGASYRLEAAYRSRIGLVARASGSFCVASDACPPMEILSPQAPCSATTDVEVSAKVCLPPGGDVASATVDGRPAVVEAAQDPRHRILRFLAQNLPEGPSSFSILVRYDDGSSEQGSASVVVDTESPSVTLVSPPAGSCLSGNQVTVFGTASAPWCGAPQVTVYGSDLYGGLIAVTAPAAVSGAWSVTLTNLQEGPTQVYAVAQDAVGHQATDGVAFATDPQPPGLYPTSVSPPSGVCTNTGSLTFAGTLTHDYCGQAVVACSIPALGESVSAVRNGLAFQCSVTAPRDGWYGVEIDARDSTGSGATLPVYFRVVTTPPWIFLSAPADGASSGGGLPYLLTRNLSGWGQAWRQSFPFAATFGPAGNVGRGGMSLLVDGQPADLGTIEYLPVNPNPAQLPPPPTGVVGTFYLPVASGPDRFAAVGATVADTCRNFGVAPTHAIEGLLAEAGVLTGSIPMLATQGTTVFTVPVDLYWPEGYASACTGGANGLGYYDLTLRYDPSLFTVAGAGTSDPDAPANPVPDDGMYLPQFVPPTGLVNIDETVPGQVHITARQPSTGLNHPIGMLSVMNVTLLASAAPAGTTSALTLTVNQVNDDTAGSPACSNATALFTRVENGYVTFGP